MHRRFLMLAIPLMLLALALGPAIAVSPAPRFPPAQALPTTTARPIPHALGTGVITGRVIDQGGQPAAVASTLLPFTKGTDGEPKVTASQSLSGIQGQFVLDKSTFVTGEPVWVTFQLTNTSAVPLHLAKAVNRGFLLNHEYSFTAYDAQGRQASPPPPKGYVISGMVADVTVAPGEMFQQGLFLSDWFTLHQAGSYTLICARTVGFFGLASGRTPTTPTQDVPVVTTVHLLILPPNKAALGSVIQQLGQGTIAQEAATRDEAALSLSVIPDPRIIPILAKLLSRSDAPGDLSSRDFTLNDFNHTQNSKFSAVAGLAQFPCDAAANALLPALDQEDEALRSAAGNALKKMKYADRVLPLLRRQITLPSASRRCSAVQAIAAIQDVRGFSLLVNALHDRDASVRYAAAKALGTLRDRRAVPILKSHFKDQDLTLRLACIQALVPLKFPILTQWLTPIVRSYALPSHEYPSLEAMTVMRLNCDYRAAPALARCLQFDDPRPSNSYNFFLIYNLEACSGGPKYDYKWINGGGDQTNALENNRKILASIKMWLLTLP